MIFTFSSFHFVQISEWRARCYKKPIKYRYVHFSETLAFSPPLIVHPSLFLAFFRSPAGKLRFFRTFFPARCSLFFFSPVQIEYLFSEYQEFSRISRANERRKMSALHGHRKLVWKILRFSPLHFFPSVCPKEYNCICQCF